MRLRWIAVSLVLCFALCACSGGGSTTSQLPAVGPVPASGSAQSIVISIKIPGGSSANAAARRPSYISSKTQSAAIAVNGGSPVVVNLAPNSANCAATSNGRTCSATVSAPVGLDRFSETLYGTTNGTGPALSQNTSSATIVAGQANVVNMVLDGVVATLSLALVNPTPAVGSAASIGLTVTFKDAGGAAIVGSDPFINPISLSDSDKSGVTTLNKATLSNPADAANVTVTYSGAALSSAVFSASAAGVASASVTLTPQSATAFNDYTTFGFDNQRDVFNPASTAITPSSVATLHLGWKQLMDNGANYAVQSQPILATGIPNHAGVLFVGGANSGNVEAHDALNGSLLWRTSTGGIEYYSCPGGGNASFGIGGSAAYDPASRSLYVTANTNNATNGFAANWLVHIDAASGAIINKYDFGANQVGPGEINFAHTSVTLGSNGIAYVGTGSTCDIPSWRGRVAGVNVASMTSAGTFFPVWNAATNYGGGGVWGWGGVALDYSGNVLTGVGNADDSTSGFQPPFVSAPTEYQNYAESLLQLSGDLSRVVAYNKPIPTSAYSGDSVDVDVQGTPAIFKPFGAGCDPMAAVQGKSGTLFLYDATAIGNGPRAQFQLSPSTFNDGYLGEPAFSGATGLVYADVASSVSPSFIQPGMIAVNPGCGSPAVTWHASFGPDSTGDGIPRSTPAISAGGVVFVASTCNGASGPCGADGPNGALWMLDASSGSILNNGRPVLYTPGHIRAPATVDGNWVYVVDMGGNLYGLTIDPNVPAITNAVRRSVNIRLQHRARPAFMPH